MSFEDLPPLNIPNLLKKHGLRPQKNLGQHFLRDTIALRQIVRAGGVSAQDFVLEIGAGLGSLTRYLAQTARHVIAVELDSALIPVLKSVLATYDNVRIVQGDILTLHPAELIFPCTASENYPNYLVVANIPYYITSALIRHLLESDVPPARMVLTLQYEVAQRICSTPNDMSLLALSVQVYGDPEIVTKISAEAFYPPPKVDSAVVQINLLPHPRVPRETLGTFFRLVKAGFSQRRKTLRNALSGGMGWHKERVEALLHTAGIDHMRRAQTLSLEEWGDLTRALSDFDDYL